jgi:hypothetical protein
VNGCTFKYFAEPAILLMHGFALHGANQLLLLLYLLEGSARGRQSLAIPASREGSMAVCYAFSY